MKLFKWLSDKVLDTNIPSINKNLCTHHYSSISKCKRCIEICPNQGIKIIDGAPEIFDCSACGKCVRDCPQLVFELDINKIMQYSNKNKLTIGCIKDKTIPHTDITINCFQQLRFEDVLSVLSTVEQLILYVDRESCKSCENDWFPYVLKMELERSLLPHDNLIIIDSFEYFKSLIGNKHKINRRDFLKNITQKGIDFSREEIIRTFEKSIVNEMISHKKINRRTRLFNQYETSFLSDEEVIPVPKLFIKKCNFCEACAKLCPNGAIKILNEVNRKSLFYSPTLCTGCRLCEDICALNGINTQGSLQVSDIRKLKWIKLSSSKERICNYCESSFYYYSYDNEDIEICSICNAKMIK